MTRTEGGDTTCRVTLTWEGSQDDRRTYPWEPAAAGCFKIPDLLRFTSRRFYAAPTDEGHGSHLVNSGSSQDVVWFTALMGVGEGVTCWGGDHVTSGMSRLSSSLS